METPSTDLQKRLTKFKDVFNQLNNTIDTYNRFQPWLLFRIVNVYEGGTEKEVLTIDTFNAQATVTDIQTKASYKISNIMLINFEYDKNGSGEANSFTLTFAFNPNEKQDSGGQLINPQVIDQALIVSSYFSFNEETATYRAIKSIGKHKCYMRYGYDFGNSVLQTPEYYGQALKCKSELRDNLIYYTITGYSSLTYLKDSKVTFGEVGTQKEKDDGSTEIENGQRASLIMAAAIYSCFGGGDSSSVSGFTTESISFFSNENQDAIRNVTSDLYKGDKITIVNQVEEGEENQIYVPRSDGKTLFDYLEDVKSRADLTCNAERAEDEKKATLAYKIEEHDKEVKFTIYVSEPTEVAVKKQAEKYITDIVYEYPSMTNNIVKSFTPDFNFETYWSGDIFTDEAFQSFQLNSAGGIVKSLDRNNTTTQRAIQTQTASTFSNVIKNAVYTADMTTVGIPADIPIGTIITVSPIINGYKYHYSGSYMILKTIDRIDTNGYTTEYELFKLAPESIKLKASETSTKVSSEEQLRAQQLADYLNETNDGSVVGWTARDGRVYQLQGPVKNPNTSGRNYRNTTGSLSTSQMHLVQGNGSSGGGRRPAVEEVLGNEY